MFDVISIGSATIDVFLKSDEIKVVKDSQVFTGQALILPYGTKSEVSQLVLQSGGGGTNTAVGFSRLGLKAAVLARCGWDLTGKLVRDEIKKEKVNDSLLLQLEGDRTDYSTILIGPDGGRTILVYRGGTHLEGKIIPWEKLESRWFYISSIEGNLDLLKDLVNFANQKGIKVAVNPGRKELNEKEKLIPILEKADVVLLNREEAAQLTGLSIADEKVFQATAFLVKEIGVVTDGNRGVVLYTHEEKRLNADGFKVETVDATGAGDAFGCGFIAGLAQNREVEIALKLGAANGASCVGKVGAKTGLLSQKNAQEWLEKPLKIIWQESAIH